MNRDYEVERALKTLLKFADPDGLRCECPRYCRSCESQSAARSIRAALQATPQEAEGIREAVEGFAEGMYIYGTTAEGHVRDVAHCSNIWRAYKRTSDFRERVDAVLAILSIPKGEPQEDTHHD